MGTRKEIIALVVEGGGMRGIFPAGVLDAFHDARFDIFNLYIGVSAGACNLSSHLASQYRRNFRIYTAQMVRPEFISMGKFLRGGHLLDLDWLWSALEREDPLDIPALYRNLKAGGGTFIVVATSIETGMPLYSTPEPGTLWDTLKASSSIPLLYRNFIAVDGSRATDGGVADPLPVREAYRRGARKIVVIRTRPGDYVKKYGYESRLTSLLYRNHPGLSGAITSQADRYREAVAFINHPPPGVAIYHVAPDTPLETSRTGQERSALLRDYIRGYQIGLNAISRINKMFFAR